MRERAEVIAGLALGVLLVAVDRVTGIISRAWDFPADPGDPGVMYDDEAWRP